MNREGHARVPVGYRAGNLAAIYGDLTSRGLPCLVMGGHAVRYYGIDRNTVDYDFHVALGPERWQRLPELLAGSELLAGLREASSWRPEDFRRFVVGTLADGRDELLECWRHNHLLPPFDELRARREEGHYGGRRIAFLGLPDLIRSKETERESDWQAGSSRHLALVEAVRRLYKRAAMETDRADKEKARRG